MQATHPPHATINESDVHKQNFKILSTNARSIISKVDELKAVAIDIKPDVIAITETWTNSSITDYELNIPGYKLQSRNDRTDTAGGRGGGILLYTKIKSYIP